MPDVQELDFPCTIRQWVDLSVKKIHTTQDIPLECVLIERVDSGPDSTDLWGEPSLKSS